MRHFSHSSLHLEGTEVLFGCPKLLTDAVATAVLYPVLACVIRHLPLRTPYPTARDCRRITVRRGTCKVSHFAVEYTSYPRNRLRESTRTWPAPPLGSRAPR